MLPQQFDENAPLLRREVQDRVVNIDHLRFSDAARCHAGEELVEDIGRVCHGPRDRSDHLQRVCC